MIDQPRRCRAMRRQRRVPTCSAGLGSANLMEFGVRFRVEVPRNGPYVFGAINDFGGGLYFLASLPVLCADPPAA